MLRSVLGLVVPCALLVVAGCGRIGLDEPIEDDGGGTGGSGGLVGTGGRGSGGIVGTGGRGSGGIVGTGGVGTGGVGTGGFRGTGGRVGTGGVLGTGGRGSGGRGTGGNAGTGGRGTGGVVGTGGRGTGGRGSGGTGGGPPLCVPGRSEPCACTDGRSGAQVCGANGIFGPCVCVDSEFERIRKGIVGTWIGRHSDPWGEPFLVEITFEADGHYSGHCAQASCRAPVFYYGIDDDSPLKTYELRDVLANGRASGVIGILFALNGVPEVRDLRQVFVSQDLQSLTFEFWNGIYGPVVFDLRRVR
jgi:hypothetical protein